MAWESEVATEKPVSQQPYRSTEPDNGFTYAVPGDHVTFHSDRTGGVLFDRQQQRIYHADRAAAFVWCSLAEGRDVNEIVGDFSHRTGLSPRRAVAYIGALFDDWNTHGLLAGAPDPVDGPGGTSPASPRPTSEPSPMANTRFFVTRVQVLGTPIAVRFNDRALHAATAPLLDGLAAPPSIDQHETLDIVQSRSGSITIRSGSEEFYRGHGKECVAAAVLATLVRLSLAQSPFHPAIHAGLIAGPNGAVLLPAPSGYGKSTLVAGLWSAGLSALGDDTVVFDMKDMSARSANPYICLKSDAWPVLQHRIPALPDLPCYLRPDGFRVRYLMPGAIRPWDNSSAGATGIAVQAMIFSRYREGEQARLSSLSTADALTHFFPCIDPIGHRLAPVDVDRLIGWIDGIERYEMVHGDLDDAVATVRQITG